MIKEFRLIQVIESVDNITRDDIEIFELTPKEKKLRKEKQSKLEADITKLSKEIEEIKNNESRVSVTPAGVHALVASGHKVLVETKAGFESGIADSEYAAEGAAYHHQDRRGIRFRPGKRWSVPAGV